VLNKSASRACGREYHSNSGPTQSDGNQCSQCVVSPGILDDSRTVTKFI
jgi:hypothetical protein